MKVRDSGMPDEATWSGFFEPPRVLSELGFPGDRADVVDFGCGYGLFAVAAAELTRGVVHAFDLDPAMVAATRDRARSLGLGNVQVAQRDFVADGTGLDAGAVDYAMLFNILHAEDPLGLLTEAYRVLRPGGRVAITHWVYDATTPRGPDLSIRPRPEQCRTWLSQAGFEIAVPFVELPPYHFGLAGRRRRSAQEPSRITTVVPSRYS